MALCEFLVFGLATWRVASLLVEEDGPWDLLGRLRYRLGVRYDEESQPYGTNVLAKALTCVWCLSLWVGIAWSVLWLCAGQHALWAALPFAFSAVAVVLNGVTKWSRN